MASSESIDETIQSESTFPEADLEGELHPSKPDNFPIDPISSDVAASVPIEEDADAEREAVMQSWKSALIISGVVVAVAAAIFVASKKLKNTRA